ncbi:hypothetical protein T11_14986 [Trichinella zimbabwensis]|uniref:Uncharacterized protein n=1 Tax=Trichinella zimbabwensis TaxID=268475 RepID=A0A0V1GW31_9BILA|nr:hypothetical protein T11_14986 [Trichinella zimbabwensis]
MRYVMFVSERVPKRQSCVSGVEILMKKILPNGKCNAACVSLQGLIPSKSEDSESNDVKCKMDMIVSRKTMQVMQALASTEVIGKHIGQVDFE